MERSEGPMLAGPGGGEADRHLEGARERAVRGSAGRYRAGTAVVPAASRRGARRGDAWETSRRTTRRHVPIRGTDEFHARRRSSSMSGKSWRLTSVQPPVIRDLDPVLDAMRLIKSARGCARSRSVAHLRAGDQGNDTLRAAGMSIRAGSDRRLLLQEAQRAGRGVLGLVAAGKNAAWPHYHAAQSQLRDAISCCSTTHRTSSTTRRTSPGCFRRTAGSRRSSGRCARSTSSCMPGVDDLNPSQRRTDRRAR